MDNKILVPFGSDSEIYLWRRGGVFLILGYYSFNEGLITLLKRFNVARACFYIVSEDTIQASVQNFITIKQGEADRKVA